MSPLLRSRMSSFPLMRFEVRKQEARSRLQTRCGSTRTGSKIMVEVSEEAGVVGPLMEGDLLVVDEQKPAQHADLVIVEVEGEQRLFNSHRIGGQIRLIPPTDRSGSFPARQSDVRGVRGGSPVLCVGVRSAVADARLAGAPDPSGPPAAGFGFGGGFLK